MKVTVTAVPQDEVERCSGPVPKWAIIARKLLKEKGGVDTWHAWHFDPPMRQDTVRTGLKRALRRLRLDGKYRVGVRRRAEDCWRERCDLFYVAFLTREDE